MFLNEIKEKRTAIFVIEGEREKREKCALNGLNAFFTVETIVQWTILSLRVYSTVSTLSSLFV